MTYELIEAPTPELIKELMTKTADPQVYAEWMLLFDEYNKVPGHTHKGMGCFPCYGKVYYWYKTRESSSQNGDNQGF